MGRSPPAGQDKNKRKPSAVRTDMERAHNTIEAWAKALLDPFSCRQIGYARTSDTDAPSLEHDPITCDRVMLIAY
jgi:hypothetical protein